jgi:hypothetical protein
MDLATARRSIQTALERMQVSYGQPVFDEWAILALPGPQGGVLVYQGPRRESFLANLARDTAPLRASTVGRAVAEGDIEFVPDAKDTPHDAFMKIGPSSYLVLNHTVKSMMDIRADSRWLAAQAELFALSEKFRSDPLAEQG